jgi:hypothetical protein
MITKRSERNERPGSGKDPQLCKKVSTSTFRTVQFKGVRLDLELASDSFQASLLELIPRTSVSFQDRRSVTPLSDRPSSRGAETATPPVILPVGLRVTAAP